MWSLRSITYRLLILCAVAHFIRWLFIIDSVISGYWVKHQHANIKSCSGWQMYGWCAETGFRCNRAILLAVKLNQALTYSLPESSKSVMSHLICAFLQL